MRKTFVAMASAVLALLLVLTACGRKGDPSPRKMPQDVHSKAAAPPAAPGEKP